MAKGFFTWAYRTGRMQVYIGDEIPSVRIPKAAPRPAPDDAWEAALAAADARGTLMLRLAGEVGLRRGEVAQVHTRDVLVAGGAAQLLVQGKGGKQRIVPISDRAKPRSFVVAPAITPQARRRRAGCSRTSSVAPDRAVGRHPHQQVAAHGLVDAHPEARVTQSCLPGYPQPSCCPDAVGPCVDRHDRTLFARSTTMRSALPRRVRGEWGELGDLGAAAGPRQRQGVTSCRAWEPS